MMLCLFFQSYVFRFGYKYLTCCFKYFKKIEISIEEIEAVSDDYYKEIDLKFILSEFQRTNIELDKYKHLIAKQQNEDQEESKERAYIIRETIKLFKEHVERLKKKSHILEASIEEYYLDLLELEGKGVGESLSESSDIVEDIKTRTKEMGTKFKKLFNEEEEGISKDKEEPPQKEEQEVIPCKMMTEEQHTKYHEQ